MEIKKGTLCLLIKDGHSEFVKVETLAPELSVKTPGGAIINCALPELLSLVKDCGKKTIPTVLCEQGTEIIKKLGASYHNLKKQLELTSRQN